MVLKKILNLLFINIVFTASRKIGLVHTFYTLKIITTVNRGIDGELRALIVLPEYLDLVLRSHMVVHNHP